MLYLSNPTVPQSETPWGPAIPLPDPRLENLMWGLESSQQRENFLVLLFAGLWAAHPVGMGFDFNVITPPPMSHCSFSFVLGLGVSFFWWVLTSSCGWLLATSCGFGVLRGEDVHTSFYSAI